ncbi:striatin-interacting protein 1 homolog [Pieris brassicae]|uniref:striatin-interacting protein 1 homolog n=1 Tax=Pieris brassicae TaxID=7116 RepID=UPI001E661BA3|nr:striatin-interacting protein 1 homolog [Pieris brassicae]
MGTNGNGRSGGAKMNMEEGDCNNDMESPELDFVYDDCDSQNNEIAELYSYTEHPEFQLNVKAFEEVMEEFSFPPSWQRLSESHRRAVIMKLLEYLDIVISEIRTRAARCILYLAQGCWAEMQSDTEQALWARRNIFLLYEMGIFPAFVELLQLEITKSQTSTISSRKLAESLADSTDLRVILSVLYLITEHMRTEIANTNSEYVHLLKLFKEELGTHYGEELLPVQLLNMITQLCAGSSPNFPMKKVLLLLWKILLVYLGGIKELKEKKTKLREQYGLPLIAEDTLEVVKGMRASSPPPSAVDILENQNPVQRKKIMLKESERAIRRQTFMKQTSMDESDEQLYVDKEDTGNGSEDYSMEFQSMSNDGSQNSNQNCPYYMYFKQLDSPPPPPPPKSLPWQSKVRQKDIDNFLHNVRIKFIGYSLPGDRQTIAGLPNPIHEGLEVLKKHIYTSISEIQVEREIEISRSPLTKGEKDIEETETELLYREMLPNLPQYMIALLKILLAAAPTSTAKTYSMNIMADLLPEEMPMTVLQSLKLGIDVNRHKEIIVKAVTAILLLLLKHFKQNHIYQFEYMSQHLVFANCMPLVLKFFNQNILSYVGAKNTIPIFDFPACVIGEQPELTKECLDIGETSVPYSWRNVFSCINLLRILNKLTKWKNARIMMLVVFKSAPILKRTLKVRHALMQFYVLKLLKMQTKYLGRQWRKTNMKTISAIYSKVRHRLNDDWAYGNDVDARPWDFQDEECTLRACVENFNRRRYITGPVTSVRKYIDTEWAPVDTNINDVLDVNIELDEEFKENYEIWLEREVYHNESFESRLYANGSKTM